MPQPLLSIVMIVKNEQNNLMRCLKAIHGAYDELCIVDTGSCDATVSIAQAHGAKMGFFTWNGVEADARNFALKLATGRWVMHLDADEGFSPELNKEILKSLEAIDLDLNYQSASLVLRNYQVDQTYELNRATRITRRRDDFQFSGTIHPTANYSPQTYHIPYCLDHYGYLWTEAQRKRKSEHLITHLRPTIDQGNASLAVLCQYLTASLIHQDDQELPKILEPILKYSLEERLAEPYWTQAVHNLILHSVQKNDFESIATHCKELLASDPNNVSALFYLTQNNVKQRNWKLVLQHTQTLLPLYSQTSEGFNPLNPLVQLPMIQAWNWLAQQHLKLSNPSANFQFTDRTLHVWIDACLNGLVTPTTKSEKIFASTANTLSAMPFGALETFENHSDLLLALAHLQVLSKTQRLSDFIKVTEGLIASHSEYLWLMKLLQLWLKEPHKNLQELTPQILHLT